jgi:hypothetical protein
MATNMDRKGRARRRMLNYLLSGRRTQHRFEALDRGFEAFSGRLRRSGGRAERDTITRRHISNGRFRRRISAHYPPGTLVPDSSTDKR